SNNKVDSSIRLLSVQPRVWHASAVHDVGGWSKSGRFQRAGCWPKTLIQHFVAPVALIGYLQVPLNSLNRESRTHSLVLIHLLERFAGKTIGSLGRHESSPDGPRKELCRRSEAGMVN